MVLVKNNLLSFTSQRREWRIRRRHSFLEEAEEEFEFMASKEMENKQNEPNKMMTRNCIIPTETETYSEIRNEGHTEKDSMELATDEEAAATEEEEERKGKTKGKRTNDTTPETEFNRCNYSSHSNETSSTSLISSPPNNSPSSTSLSLLPSQEFYFYSASKTSKLQSHFYDEDWYIRYGLAHKKNNRNWAAKIYLY